MAKICLFVCALAMALMAAGCSSSSGSREFIPGKGWIEND